MRIKRIIVVMLICILLFVIAFSGWKILSAMQKYHKSEESYSTIAKQYIELDYKQDDVTVSVDFEKLKSTYSDVIGWIYSENTPINYPIVQGENNDYYLRRLPNGKRDVAGSIFADFRNSSDFSDFKTIIYGHNMKNNSMFGTLEKYKSQKYYDEHPIMYLLTKDKNYKILLIGGYTASADSEDTYFISSDKKDRNVIIEKTLKKSTFKSDVKINEDDRFITLSTCAYDFEDARYVVVGVLREVKDESVFSK